MKIRTLDELSHKLRDDLGWRRKELVAYKSLVKKSIGPAKQAYLRGGYAITYAHWEGYVKYSIDAYIDYVRLRNLTIGELDYGFIGMILKPQIKHTARSESSSGAVNTADFTKRLLENWNKRAFLPPSEKLSTQSNLWPSVLKEMMLTVGLPYTNKIQVAEIPTIKHLVETRNHLAHGGRQHLDHVDFDRVNLDISALMVEICSLIENAATNTSYKRTPNSLN